MADVRALLKAKRQEARITHPYAAYGASGALRCTACGTAIKFASAWEGHLGSKAHRVSVVNLKAKEKEEALALSKRKAAEGQEEEQGDGEEDGQMELATAMTDPPRPGKRQRTEEREIVGAEAEAEAHHPPPQTQASHPFPMDFFSDPARAAPTTRQDDDDEMDQDEEEGTSKSKSKAKSKSQFDVAWDAFERDMQNLSRPGPVEGTDTTADPQEMYARATIAAEPDLVPNFVGLPTQVAGMRDGAEEAPGAAGPGEVGRKKKMTEEEERKRKELDERELIIDRLMEEERAQEDAYNRVALLKNRVQMLKKKRELAKAKGKKAEADTQP